jgi:CHAD domain-containing protein
MHELGSTPTRDSRAHRERELKFDVPDDWELPDPAALVPDGSVERESVHLESAYYDTIGRTLLHHRLTLRRRTGDADTGWHLKVPDGNARQEITLPLAGRAIPAEVRLITLGVRGGAALKPLAVVRTERVIHRLVDAAGTLLAEIVVDSVTATESIEGAVSRQWREVEVELVQGDEKLLGRSAKWLAKRGAEPSSSASKLARALDVRIDVERDLANLSGLIGSYLDQQLEAIVRGDIALRGGQDAVHATRVATRRYRSVLRVFGKLLDAGRAAELDTELARFGAALGEVRDRQVLRSRLDERLAELPPDVVVGPVQARIHDLIAAEQAQAEDNLAALMRTPRHFALLTELRAWRQDLPMEYDRQADEVRRFLAKAEKKATRRLRKARNDDARLHRARKAAKRARYAAELCQPAFGRPAEKMAKRMKKLQRRLGERQDAVMAAEFLRRAGDAAAAAGESGFTFGLLYAGERAGE